MLRWETSSFQWWVWLQWESDQRDRLSLEPLGQRQREKKKRRRRKHLLSFFFSQAFFLLLFRALKLSAVAFIIIIIIVARWHFLLLECDSSRGEFSMTVREFQLPLACQKINHQTCTVVFEFHRLKIQKNVFNSEKSSLRIRNLSHIRFSFSVSVASLCIKIHWSWSFNELKQRKTFFHNFHYSETRRSVFSPAPGHLASVGISGGGCEPGHCVMICVMIG